MAKQKGPIYFTGSRGGLCFYELDGAYYVRRKSTLSGKRVKRDPKFALTMVYAGIMGRASKIAAAVYHMIPLEERVHTFYRILTGAAMTLLKQGVEADLVRAMLEQEFLARKKVLAGLVEEEGMEVVSEDPACEGIAVEARRCEAKAVAVEMMACNVTKAMAVETMACEAMADTEMMTTEKAVSTTARPSMGEHTGCSPMTGNASGKPPGATPRRVKPGKIPRVIKHPQRIGIRVDGLHVAADGLLQYLTLHTRTYRKRERNA